jgi:uncharacterized membrane protein HdeD (DUF308 family)
MKMRGKYILLVAGVTSSIFGIMYSIPAILQDRVGIATIGTLMLVTGLVLIAIAFGEE